jgi:RNase P/RNase MRP subunit POP5|tara:strand:- start:1410 stop:1661 length:252 start_codon:yes stop_codon:yes gene_type:complete
VERLTGRLVGKLVQLGALNREQWRPRLFYSDKSHPRQYINVTAEELQEVIAALEFIRHETKHNLEKNQRMYANRVIGRNLFDA